MIRRATLLAFVGLLSGCGGGAGSSTSQTAAASAARFLVSDPYPITMEQPNHFDVACDGSAAATSAPAVNPDGTSFLHYDLSALLPGSHNCSIAAADAANNESAASSVSFTL
jgi:hypothetical protein